MRFFPSLDEIWEYIYNHTDDNSKNEDICNANDNSDADQYSNRVNINIFDDISNIDISKAGAAAGDI